MSDPTVDPAAADPVAPVDVVAAAASPPQPAAAVPEDEPLSQAEIWRAFWPLGFSWFFMSLEGPVLYGLVARLADPELNLAAFGGVTFPLSLIVEAPIIMLLSAATALVTDTARFTAVRRYMFVMCASLTALHLALALTPLFDLVVADLLGVPPELHRLVWISLLIMTPWTPAIGYRRFYQGVLIRCGRSRDVTIGTIIRFGSVVAVMGGCFALAEIPGAAAGAAAIIAGVVAEAVFAGVRGRRVVRDVLSRRPVTGEPMSARRFAAFYTPLALTALISFLTIPLGTAAITRLPETIDSLAAFPQMSSLSFMFLSFGIGMSEVTIAYLHRRDASRSLAVFARRVGLVTAGVLVLMAATPLSKWWFAGVGGLHDRPLELAAGALLLFTLAPYLNSLQHFYQGALVATHRTRPVTESVVVNLLVSLAVVVFAVAFVPLTGIYLWSATMLVARFAQLAWTRAAALEAGVLHPSTSLR